MSKKKFTEREVAVLRANPFTFSVNPNQITFTQEFKQLFWEGCQDRMKPAEIFRMYGYDPAIIGRNRIAGFGQSLKKDVEAGLDFCEGRRPSRTRKEKTGEDVKMRDMQHQIDLLKQEMAFLKKISSLRISRK